MKLSELEKSELINLARESIREKLERRRASKLNKLQAGILHTPCGAFVSLYVKGKLRGCIGTFSEEFPLYKNIRNMAISAATSDSRFDPIDLFEVDEMQIEISILTPRERIFDISLIELGKHGIFMKCGRNRGTLLPQVAIDQNWTLEEFLGNCAKHKAGLGWEGWKKAELYAYEALVFKSESLPNC